MDLLPLKLSLSCEQYERTIPLLDGSVALEGIDLDTRVVPSSERHHHMLTQQCYDICELSLSSYLLSYTQGNLPFLAIPVFPLRIFRHSDIWIRRSSGIEIPEDLKGKKIGVRRFQNSCALWVRGFLEEDYGVASADVVWVVQDEEEIEFERPAWLKWERPPAGKKLKDMLIQGEIDALIYPSIPTSFGEEHPSVHRLFPNVKLAEIEYYQRTRNYPIMHTVVIKKELLEQHPWVAQSVFDGFCKAQEISEAKYAKPGFYDVSWMRELVEQEARIMGPFPRRYGLAINRHDIETEIRHSFNQGIIKWKPTPEELFVPIRERHT